MQNKETNNIVIFLHTAKANQSETSGKVKETPWPQYSSAPNTRCFLMFMVFHQSTCISADHIKPYLPHSDSRKIKWTYYAKIK